MLGPAINKTPKLARRSIRGAAAILFREAAGCLFAKPDAEDQAASPNSRQAVFCYIIEITIDFWCAPSPATDQLVDRSVPAKLEGRFQCRNHFNDLDGSA
jgi:hypothetical protein